MAGTDSVADARRWTIRSFPPAEPKLLSVATRKLACVAAVNIKTRGRAALSLLVESHRSATRLQCSIWDWAVDARRLRRAGFTQSDLRWLVCKGFVHQAREVTTSGQTQRDFLPARGLKFCKRTCFILNAAGMRFASSECQAD